MNPERWRRIEEMFARAVELPAAERATYLAESCGGDAELRDELESLLAAAAGASGVLERAIGACAASLVAGRFGPYQVVSVLGEGGMGTVYLAERDDDEYRRRVAIKVLRGGPTSPQAVARFRDERQVLAGLDHPGIVRLLDGGRADDGSPYLVMEYIEGAPFAAHARGLELAQRVALVIRIAEALQYAHQQLVVHRDVKPSNLLVDRDGAPRLLDFGIAKLLDPEAGREAATRTGAAAFTVEYASPEQVRGETVTVATDVYSLGAVLYDVLVGHPPQRAGATPLETLANICQREPVRPSTAAPASLRRALSGDLDNIMMRALAKQPEQRYPSMAAFASDLQRHLSGQPVAARRPTWAYRAGKLVRRHRGALALAVMVLATLAAATVVSLLQARRADRQAARAEAGRRTLLVERGRQELATGHPGRALPYLAEALSAGADTAAVRVLLGAAMRPYRGRIATISEPQGFADAAWSPDGGRLAFTSAGAHGGLYDRDGRRLAALEDDGVVDLQPTFSPSGALIASADLTGRVFVWDAVTGQRRQRLTVADSRWAVGFVFLDDRRLATAASDQRLIVWDLVTGTQVSEVAAGCSLRSVAVSPDGTTIAASCDDGALLTFEVSTLRPGRRLDGHHGAVWRLAFSRDGTRLYSCAADRTTRIWDLARGTSLATLRGSAFALSSDGARLLASGEDSIGRIHDAATGLPLVELVGHELGGIRSQQWSRDGSLIATAGVDGAFRTWDAATGEPQGVIDAAVGAGSAPSALSGALTASISPDGLRLLTLSGRGAALWRTDHGALLDQVNTGGELWSASWDPTGRRVGFAGDRRAGIRGADMAPVDVDVPDGGWMYDVNWSPDGTRLVLAGKPSIARIVAADGRVLVELEGHGATVNRAAFDRDGGRVATASSDGTARIWDAGGGALVQTLAHPGPVLAAAWSADGRRLATAGLDHHLRVWDVARGSVLIDLDGGTVEYLDVTMSPDGRALAAAGRAGEIEIWDLGTRMRRRVLVGHTLNATNAVWSGDGALIATASSDHTVRVWDPDTGALLATFRHPDEVMSLQWSRDGQRLLSGCHDGLARTWDVRRATGTAAEIRAFVAAHAL